MIFVIAEITVAEGKRDEFVKLFNANVPAVLAEDGCIEYGPAVDVETNVGGDARPNVVTVVEKWESIEALEAHLIAPHMLTFRESAKELLQGVDIKVLEPAT